ncbi:probable acyl-activating enzyme 17, peroxisomal isoform X2 [Durio zibethinus]|uniref:Probable acyl-activating enzyme 17, peroxisomal isoform X2 n=1 Tax=Durio zibethinus TaxID=66656 RepID=A0A6P5YE74_DURZI|nr:probable acyl-activating enzyme 17, peroxisomal isoform X2 [Durio zibethinus]
MVYKSLDSVTVEDIEASGISSQLAEEIHRKVAEIVNNYGAATPETWNLISKHVLTPNLPFSLHQMMYYGCYKDFGPDPPAWIPDPENALLTNVGLLLERHGKEFLGNKYKDPISSFSYLQEFSVSNPEVYWKTMLDEMCVNFSVPPDCILHESPSEESQVLNPGYVVVSIADSFAPLEISTRLKISEAKAIFTQDLIIRGEKSIPLYSRVVEAQAPMAIVIPARGSSFSIKLRDGDISWPDFLESVKKLKGDMFKAVEQPVEAFTNILFSSGTTGEPKAIPWTNVTPFKAAADAWCHMDIRRGDIVAWPTNLGWMMGPWLVYASLLNGASMALYNGSPLTSGFAKFVQDAKVTMLGVIPSIVRTWKSTNCMAGYDWSSIRCFSSTGEASNVDEYLWLMGRACYKPIIEYCGGTEIGGGFVSGSFLQPQSLAAFSTPAMGCRLFILGDDGHPIPQDAPGMGELALGPLMFGSSSTLLNASHYDVYFKGMPSWKGLILRRHGDVFERTSRGYYHAHGRADDTMNIGGIKVSSVEIERICNAVDSSVLETAAIGVPPADGGPERLVIAVVFKDPDNSTTDLTQLRISFNSAVQKNLNPLFRVSYVVALSSLPRTASNKVMRRVLRKQLAQVDQNSKL